MTDAEKCRLIAEFEGENGLRSIGMDYPHDLNATMRAARRLPDNLCLSATHFGAAFIDDQDKHRDESEVAYSFVEGDPARAAFECLASYLVEKGK